MRLGLATLAMAQLCLAYASLAGSAPQVLRKVEGRVMDAALYDSALVAAFDNGTIAYAGEGFRWRVPVSVRGAPLTVEHAHPYGLLVLTSSGWLGLVPLSGGEGRWSMLRVDVSALKKGDYSLAYANGTIAVLAGRKAVFKSLPSLEDAGPGERVLNRYVKCVLSRNGTLALLLGINTLCHVCLENDERLIEVRQVREKVYLAKVELDRVKDVGVDEAFSKIYVARWRQLSIYRLRRGGLAAVSNITFPHRAVEWKSYGFSPRARFFHYTCLEGKGLVVVLLDLSSERFRHYTVATGLGGAVHSLVDDKGRVFVLVNNPVSRSTTLICLDPATGTTWQASWRGFARIKVVGDHVVVVTEQEAILVSLRGVEHRAGLVSLTVRVVDESGAPVPGALVALNSSFLATTSEEGVAVLTLEPGFYIVEASSPSYTPARASLSLVENASLELQLEKLYTLEVGGVFDNGTVPSTCYIAVMRGGDVVWSSEAEGCRATLNVTRGKYTVSVRAGGGQAEGSWEVARNTRAIVTLRGTYRVLLHVLGEDGLEVENATVTVETEDGEMLAELRGARCVMRLPAGVYRVRVSAPGYNQTTLLLSLEGQEEVEVQLKRLKEGEGEGVSGEEAAPPSWAPYVGAAVVAASLLTYYVLRRGRHASPTNEP